MRSILRPVATGAATGFAVSQTAHWGYTSALSVVLATFTGVWFGFEAVWPKRRAWWRRGA